ncbi:MAG: hypothetical protein PHD11_01765 [Bacteroidales bacterium]|mgnify:CR=1 FL=1|nr:hypothetical protein [Bacteroidales bacterium]MDD4670083.1 hypothetical protein [Bacteroidales bacterium]
MEVYNIMNRKRFLTFFALLMMCALSFAQNSFDKNYKVEGLARKVGSKFQCFIYKGFDEPCLVFYDIHSNSGDIYSDMKIQISYRKGFIYTGFTSDRYFTVNIKGVTIFDEEGNIKDQEVFSDGRRVRVKIDFTPVGLVSAIALFPISLASDVYVRNQLGVYNFDYNDFFSNFSKDFDVGFRNTWLSHATFEWGFSYRDVKGGRDDLGVNAGIFCNILNNRKLPVINPYVGLYGHYFFTNPDIASLAPTAGLTIGWKYYRFDFRYSLPYMFDSKIFDVDRGFIQGGIAITFQPTKFSLFSHPRK